MLEFRDAPVLAVLNIQFVKTESRLVIHKSGEVGSQIDFFLTVRHGKKLDYNVNVIGVEENTSQHKLLFVT